MPYHLNRRLEFEDTLLHASHLSRLHFFSLVTQRSFEPQYMKKKALQTRRQVGK